MRIYGLTGGIASGKSEAAKRFEQTGVPVIDADRVGHEILESDPRVASDIVATFGASVCSCGRIDREKLGKAVFGSPALLAKLNAIIHPAIYRAIGERCAAYAEKGIPTVIVDAALLGEGGRKETWLEGLILVTCPEDLRIQRMVESRGMSEEEAKTRVAAQTRPENKIPLADWVVDNSGTREELWSMVDEVAEAIHERDKGVL